MKTALRILVVEDSEDDALLVLLQIKKGGYNVDYKRVETAKEMVSALREKTWDIILTDYIMPHFNGLEAITILKESGIDIPIIVISGTIGEEVAVETMKAGAHDYLMKDNLKRLIPAIERELLESKNRAERRRAEVALKEQYSTLRSIIDSTDSMIFSLDRQYRYTSFNHRHASVMKTIYGVDIEIGHSMLDYMTVEEDRETARRNIDRVLQGEPITEEAYSGEELLSRRYFRISHSPVQTEEGAIIGVVVFAHDLTERKLAEVQLLKLNRIYAVLSNINKAIVRVRDPQTLLNEACRIAVEYGKFKMAWVGMVNWKTSKLEVVDSYGFTGHYLDKINIDLTDIQRSSGPGGSAARTGKHKISNNVATDESMGPWQADAEKYGYQSVASFPLIVFNKVIGAFTLYDSEVNCFHEDDINLLDEMANDISFALEFIETEKNHKEAEKALRESEERFRLIAENTADTIAVLDMDFAIKYVSPSVIKLRGYSAKEALSQSLDQIFTQPSLEKIKQLYAKQMELEASGTANPVRTELIDLEEYCKDGTTIWVEIALSFIRDANQKPMQILTISRDITQYRKAEEERKAQILFLQNLEHINLAIKHETILEEMLWKIVRTVFSMFDCDRAWLLYPCDPTAAMFRIPVEVTSPEFPGANVLNIEIPLSPDFGANLQDALDSDDPVTYLEGSEQPINKVTAGQFNVRSQMFVALYPKVGKPWVFGLHQCSHARIWTDNEKTLFKEIGRRLADALTSLLATQQLKESEIRYREIFENTSDVIIVSEVDNDGRLKLLDLNPAWEKVIGLKRDDFLGKYLDMLYPHESIEKVLAEYHRCITSKTPVDFEHELTSPAGYRNMYSTFVPVCKADGTIYRLIGVSRDITLQKKAEKSLRDFKTATDQSPASIVITGFDGTIEYVNPKFTEISGYSFEEAVGQNPRFLKSGEMTQEEYKTMWATILSGAEWKGEFHNKRKNGSLYWETASISSIKDDNGKIIHFIAVKEDITDRKFMEMELREAKEKAEEISRLKSSLLLNMSHEFRTPMNGILGFTELLKDQPLDSDSLKMVDIISSSGKRLMTTLNSILDLAQVEAGKLNFQLTLVHLGDTVRSIREQYIELANNKQLEFICEIEENVYAWLDERLFQNVLHHLLDNAIKFTNAGSVILTVKKEELPDNEFATIVIKDSGLGIKPDNMQLIFEAFRQGSEGIGRNFEGTGLGLTLCKKFVDLLKGDISAESMQGIGSTFTVRFPSCKPSLDELASETQTVESQGIDAPAEHRVRGKKPRILIVEDNEHNCELMEIYLRSGFDTDTVHSGKQAVKNAFMHQYDLILMDINLGPDMDGIQATREIRRMENYKNVPIIAVTGYSAFEEREKILAGGLNCVITKPFTREELVKAVTSVTC